jgi:hypothetical protein
LIDFKGAKIHKVTKHKVREAISKKARTSNKLYIVLAFRYFISKVNLFVISLKISRSAIENRSISV